MTRDIVGLSQREVEESRSAHGENILKKEKTKGFFKRFIENLDDPIIKILFIALGVEILITLGRVNYFEIFVATRSRFAVRIASKVRSDEYVHAVQHRVTRYAHVSQNQIVHVSLRYSHSTSCGFTTMCLWSHQYSSKVWRRCFLTMMHMQRQPSH